jgi:oxygen-dependent protoporphyrinogen oxidase
MTGTERVIGVVGSGAAGLAAAWRLSSGGRVRVYEAGARIGGALRTVEVAGTRADPVVQLLSANYVETRGMLRSLGLGDRLVAVPGRDALWRGGAAHAVRYGSFASMLSTRALPSGLKLKLGLRYVPFLERQGELSMHDPAAAAALDGESIAAWGRREIGEGFVELLAYPLLASYYGVTPEETSAAFFHGLARAGTSVEVIGVRGGAGALAAAIGESLEAAGVEFRTGARVERVAASGGGVRVETGRGVHEHAGLVVAVPAREAARLVSDPLASTVKARGTAVLVLATREPVRTGWFGLSIPRGEAPGETLASICVQEAKGTGLGEGGGALVLIPSPSVGPRWAESEPEAVLGEALRAAERVLPGVGANVREAQLVRRPEGVWLPEPGHFRRVAAGAPTPMPGVALAGAYRVAPTVEGAVRSGLGAASVIESGG